MPVAHANAGTERIVIHAVGSVVPPICLGFARERLTNSRRRFSADEFHSGSLAREAYGRLVALDWPGRMANQRPPNARQRQAPASPAVRTELTWARLAGERLAARATAVRAPEPFAKWKP